MDSASALLLAIIAVGIWLPNLDVSQKIITIVTYFALGVSGGVIVLAMLVAWFDWQESKR